MKRNLIALLLSACMILSLAACGRKDGSEEPNGQPSALDIDGQDGGTDSEGDGEFIPFEERWMDDSEVDPAPAFLGANYGFDDPAYVSGTGISYREPLSYASGEIWDLARPLGRYDSEDGFHAGFEEYAEGMVSALESTGAFGSVEILGDGDARGRTVYAAGPGNAFTVSVDCDRDGYQRIAYTADYYPNHMDASGIDVEEICSEIIRYTGILLDPSDYEALADIISRNSLRGGGNAASVEDPEACADFRIGVLDYGMDLERWSVYASRVVSEYMPPDGSEG